MRSVNEKGINIVGHLNEHSGTSIAAHAVISALKKQHIPLAYHELPPQASARNGASVAISTRVAGLEAMPYRATLLLDVPFITDAFYKFVGSLVDRFTMGTVLYWELENLPYAWYDTFEKLDVIFSPSTIVDTAVKNSIGRVPPRIPVVPPDIALPPRSAAADRPFTFFTNFDIMSSIQRKNPYAAISAYRAVFGHRNDVQLIVKIWESDKFSINREPLLELQRQYPSIKLVFGQHSYEETRRLLASADAYISLHRSEGLGLGMLEAFAAGMPVIATDYGGNADYLDESCGFPVPYSMVSTEGPDEIYSSAYVGRSSVWADPDLSFAASAMQQLVADRAGYARLSVGARRRYEERRKAFESLAWLAPLYRKSERIEVVREEIGAPWTAIH